MTEDFPYRKDPEEADDAPPGPLVNIVLRHKHRDFPCTALLDTGAAFSTITEAARQFLGPKRSGERRVRGATENDSNEYPMYRVDALYFAGLEYSQFELTHLQTSTRIVIIGRDILNQRQILLDGPNTTLSID
jgi:hypothetical protein